MTLLRVCADCGELSDQARCREHRPPEPPKPSANRRGYDSAWRELSERARRLQPWCSDCHSTSDLTTDHSEKAWKRKAEGKPIRLRDVDVVCRSCNARRGRARPTGDRPHDTSADPRAKAESQRLNAPEVEPPGHDEVADPDEHDQSPDERLTLPEQEIQARKHEREHGKDPGSEQSPEDERDNRYGQPHALPFLAWSVA